MDNSTMLDENSNITLQYNNVSLNVPSVSPNSNSQDLFWDDVIDRTTNISGVLDVDDFDSLSPTVASLPGYGDSSDRAYGLFSSSAIDGVNETSSTPVEHTDNFFDRLFENLEEDDHTTEAEPCKAVATELYPHQKQALNWMIGKENKNTLPPFWEQCGDYYKNTITHEMRQAVNSVVGGILADDMGLGKTLEMIALILTNFVDGKPLALPRPQTENAQATSADTETNKHNVKRENQPKIHAYLTSSPSTSATDSVSEKSTLTSCSQPSGRQPSIDVRSSERPVKRPNIKEEKIKEEEHSSAKYGRWEEIEEDKGDLQISNHLPEPSSFLSNVADVKIFSANGEKIKTFKYETNDTSNSASDGIIDVSDSDSVIIISDSEEEEDIKPTPTFSNKITDDDILLPTIKPPWKHDKIVDEEVGRKPKPAFSYKITDDEILLETIKPPWKHEKIDDEILSETIKPPWKHEKIDEEVNIKLEPIVIKKVTDFKGTKYVSYIRRDLQEVFNPLQSWDSGSSALSQKDDDQGYDSSTGRCKTTGPRGTLIVCPTSVLYNWEDQFRQHVDQTVCLNLYVHYGKSRTSDIEFIKKQDVVITTYHTLIADFKKTVKGVINNTEWLRIVLDEGHNIRNPKTATAKIVFGLKAQRRWVLTGTPIQNTLEDLWSIVNFLKVEPLTDKRCWNRTIANPVATKDDAMQRVFHLMRNLALRRTKTQQVNGRPILDLPARNVVLKKLTLSQEQREAYDLMENEGKILIRQYIENNTVRDHLFEIYVAQLRLRQFCCHPKLVYKAVVNNPAVPVSDCDKERYKDIYLNDRSVLAGESAICSTCLKYPKNAVVASNGGIYCWSCIQESSGPYQADMMVPEKEMSVLEIKALREQLESADTLKEDCIICTNTLQAGVITQRGHMYCRACFEKNPVITQAYETISEAERKQLLGKLLMWLYDHEDYSECPICYSKSMEIGSQKAAITFCGHQFCCACIDKLCANQKHPPCPICRQELDRNKLIKIPLKLTDGTNLDEWSSSAKLDALLSALTDLKEKDPSIKSIVISQFTSLLDLIEKALSENGLTFTRLDGKMSQSKRLDAMKRFSEASQDSPTVFLLSLKAGGVGINLSAASRVFLMEPYWNPAAEEQCFDRCHRLGQTRDVEITKFVIENSVEESMLKLQERKRQLMNGAFLQKLTKEQRRVNYINDLIQLFQID